MGYELFVAVGRCKKHPQHRQSPGVCSCCLREKLSYVVNINNNFTATNSTASSLFWSSSDDDDDHIPSPNHNHHHQQQQQQEQEQPLQAIKVSTSSTRNGIIKKDEFKRSRSVEVVIRKELVDDDDDRRFNKKRFGRGFWLRLLNKPPTDSRRNKDKMSVMMHSRTMTEKRTQRV